MMLSLDGESFKIEKEEKKDKGTSDFTDISFHLTQNQKEFSKTMPNNETPDEIRGDIYEDTPLDIQSDTL